jgi:hypothetical protein
MAIELHAQLRAHVRTEARAAAAAQAPLSVGMSMSPSLASLENDGSEGEAPARWGPFPEGDSEADYS